MTARVIGLKPGRLLESATGEADLPSVRLGRVAALDLPAGVWIEFPAAVDKVLARLAVEVSVARLRLAIEQRQSAVLAFEDGDAGKPIVLGFLAPAQPAQARDEAPDPAQGLVVETEADGRRVRLQAQEEIVLQCGESSISLKRNGRVVIRGAYIETNATTTNRIKGGNVRIN